LHIGERDREMTAEHDEELFVEEEGKSVDEAVQRALDKLQITRDLADIEVLETGSRGLFSVFGAKNARVRVTIRDEAWEERVRDVVVGLMERMGINSQVHVETIDQVVHVRIDSAGSDGLLIGRKGETLQAIQHLVTRMVNRDNVRRVQVAVDVGGYRKRRETQLENLAKSLGARVEATGQQTLTEPLSAAERRIIHITLADNPAVRTETVGEGLVKKVAVIRVKENAGVARSSTK
jgi:spoIIIJ-associated protein